MSQYLEIDGGMGYFAHEVGCWCSWYRVCLGLLCPSEWETADFPGSFSSSVIEIPRKEEVFMEPALGCSCWLFFVPCEFNGGRRLRVYVSCSAGTRQQRGPAGQVVLRSVKSEGFFDKNKQRRADMLVQCLFPWALPSLPHLPQGSTWSSACGGWRLMHQLPEVTVHSWYHAKCGH